MKNSIGNKALQTITLAAVAALCISTSASALTKEELLTYSENVNCIVEENSLQVAPGSLKKMSQEERQRKHVEVAKAVQTDNVKYTLSYYSDLFIKCAERLSQEMKVNDPDLAGWHRKLVAGYQDSYEVTNLALGLLKNSSWENLRQALTNTELQKRIRANQVYHHTIRAELDNIIKSYFPTDGEIQRLSKRLVGLYVETTWK